jgi:hypothetical protein
MGGDMKKLMVVAALAATCFAIPAFAAGEADCEAMWKKADANGDGTLSDNEAMRYSAAMRVHEQKVSQDGTIARADFVAACKSDVYAERKNDPGAPLKGSNSFTENQAKDRAMAYGYANVSSLKKDDNGVWHGTASQDGKSANVAIDFKGNVVSQAAQ